MSEQSHADAIPKREKKKKKEKKKKRNRKEKQTLLPSLFMDAPETSQGSGKLNDEILEDEQPLEGLDEDKLREAKETLAKDTTLVAPFWVNKYKKEVRQLHSLFNPRQQQSPDLCWKFLVYVLVDECWMLCFLLDVRPGRIGTCSTRETPRISSRTGTGQRGSLLRLSRPIRLVTGVGVKDRVCELGSNENVIDLCRRWWFLRLAVELETSFSLSSRRIQR